MARGYGVISISIVVGLFMLPLHAHAQGAGIPIACINDSGEPTSSSITCNAILPKCSDLKASNETAVKNFLSWKIWGYYQGKNIDLNSSTLSATHPVFAGPDLLYPICSVVGHTMQFNGTPPLKAGAYNAGDASRATQKNAYLAAGIEYAQQTIGKKISCGTRPATTSGYNPLVLTFQNGAGNLWNSYLIGAYPWLIRRYAYEVLTAIKPDLSNLGDIITDPSVLADVTNLNKSMNTYYTGLSNESKSACSGTNSNIVNQCMNGSVQLSDPANRLCTLVKAQSTMNAGALPNMIVREIMARVQTNYDALFTNTQIMSFKNAPSKNLWGVCKDTGGFFHLSSKKKAGLTASCLFDGANFYAYGSGTTQEDRGGYSKPTITRISDGAAMGMGSPSGIGSDKTLLLGFGGVVESVIRRDICKQQRITDTSICDTVNIPDMPVGVTGSR